MKVAVAYENGEVFQHFGHTENFKVYEIEKGQVVSSEVIGTEGAGHEAIADFLKEKKIGAVIVGGMGQGAADALFNAGIEVYSGVKGPADEAVEAYLNDELLSEGVNCDHEEEAEGGMYEEEGCGGCGGNCGSCGGGCGGCGGAMRPIMEGKNVGKTVRVHYRGTFNDGTQFDASYDRGEPLEFVSGVGMMIPGFDKAVADMEVGESVDIHLMPEEAYGEKDPQAIFTIEIAQMPGAENVSVGQKVFLSNQFGQQFPATVTAKDEKNVTFDANHELAGVELNFHIELLEVKEG